MKTPITPATEEKLRFATDGTLRDFYPYLSDRHKQINQIDSALVFLTTRMGIDKESDDCLKMLDLRKLTEFNMLITIFHLDLSVIVNIFLNGKSDYEKLFALKQGMVIINEGYKKIFNFVNENKDGSPNYTQRQNSFWNKDIRLIVNQYPKLSLDFEMITKQLDEYYDTSFDTIKDIRDLTVHYDREPDKFYQMLISLDTEVIFDKLTGFVNIINKMYIFMPLIMNEMSIDIGNKSAQTKQLFDSTIDQIQYVLNGTKVIDKSFKTDILEKIEKLKKLLDHKKKNEA